MDFKRIEEMPTDVTRRVRVPENIIEWSLKKRARDKRGYAQKATVKHIYMGLMKISLKAIEEGAVIKFERYKPEDDSKEPVLRIPSEVYEAAEKIAGKIEAGEEGYKVETTYVISVLDVLISLLVAGYEEMPDKDPAPAALAAGTT